MTVSNSRALIRHLPVGAAIAVATVAAVCFAVMPASALESLVWRTGIAALIPAAQPPLGLTARAVLALATAGVGAAVTWSALFLLVGPGGLLVRPARREDGVPIVRRADAHPDAPPRRPMSAADLGTPLMEVSAANPVELERSIPADLDQPLAAFDPHAILPVPMAPVPPVAPLVQTIETGSRPPVRIAETRLEEAVASTVVDEPEDEAIEPNLARAVTIDAPVAPATVHGAATPISARRAPVVRDVVEPAATASIESLLRRLEQGALRRRQMTIG